MQPDPRLTAALRIVYGVFGLALFVIGVGVLFANPSWWLFFSGALLVAAGAGAIGGAVLGYMPVWLQILIDVAVTPK